MTQTLYKFGVDPSYPTANTDTPVPVITGVEVKILWSSWCDLIYSTLTSDVTHSIAYIGTSLNVAQHADFRAAPWAHGTSNMRQTLLEPGIPLTFFGTAMHDGVRGYVSSSKVTVYGTPAEKAQLGDQYRDIDSWRIPYTLRYSLLEVSMCSDNSLLVACRPKPVPEPDSEELEPKTSVHPDEEAFTYCEGSKATKARPQVISHVANLQELKNYGIEEASVECVAQFAPTLLVVNATTATALDQDGRVYTRTTDPRYSSCLGRPYTGTSTFEAVPYLSETRITKISSGGYMTAAISEDGELFLWGQANPGTEGDLRVLHEFDSNDNTASTKGTVIWSEIMEDEDVKCLNIHIDGKVAVAYDVAVGFGHILVAARNVVGEHVVFAAGSGDEGQLGLSRTCDFMPEFEEVMALRGKRVMQLAAAGWSSFVVVNE